MTAYDKLKAARANGRPTALSYIENILTDYMFFHGDRRFGEDAAIEGGIGYLGKIPVTFLSIEKGTDLPGRMRRNFGCPKPEGYRKALRLMKQAEKFGRPVICFVDTLGAYCGAEAEERGQGQAIAENILEMSALQVPILTTVIGEGGSGGALGLGMADRVYMLRNAVYSVISPEGCASIIWKDSSKVADAAECLHITAEDMAEFGVAEHIFEEDFINFDKMCTVMRSRYLKDLSELRAKAPHLLLDERYNRYRRIGVYSESRENI